MADAKDQATEAQQTFFRITDNVPEEVVLGGVGLDRSLRDAQALWQGRLGHLRRAVAAHLPAVRALPPPDPAASDSRALLMPHGLRPPRRPSSPETPSSESIESIMGAG